MVTPNPVSSSGSVRSVGSPQQRLDQVGEDAVVRGIIDGLPAPSWLLVPPGDDAAVLASVEGALVAGTDTMVENADFRRDWSTAEQVGGKIAAQNLADIAAMGAEPWALLLSLAAPRDLPVEWTLGLRRGVLAECARAGAVLVGGDVSDAAEIVLTGTGLGRFPAGSAPVRRDGARVGDVVALAGDVGLSAAGLAVLGASGVSGGGAFGGGASGSGASGSGASGGGASGGGATAGGAAAGVGAVVSGAPAGEASVGVQTGASLDLALEMVLDLHRWPRPPYPAGVVAARAGASSMIDTSDGLLRDAARLAMASKVVLDLDSAALARMTTGTAPGAVLPKVAEWLEGAGRVADLVRTWQLQGGEDHALLATFPPGTVPESFVVIGEVRPAALAASDGAGRVTDGASAVLLDGREVTGPLGWQHWTSNTEQ